MNRRDLKAYMRLDYQKRRVPGSLVLRKSMPKNGSWVEIDAWECCGTTTPTTTQYCEGPLCSTTLTVGSPVPGVFGYYVGVFGTLVPDCSNVIGLYWEEQFEGTNVIRLYVGADYGINVIVEIDGVQYTFEALGAGPPFWYYFVQGATNPFPTVGGTHTVRICGVEVTTTTTTTTATPTTTTTTTICVPEGVKEPGQNIAAATYTPTIGEDVDFHTSGEDACLALEVFNDGGGTFNYQAFDVYVVGGVDFYYYYEGTCTLVESGFYVHFGETGVGIYTDGEYLGDYECTTTTTTTVEVPSDIHLKDNVVKTGNKIGEFNEYTWNWNPVAISLGYNKFPNKGVIAQEVEKVYPDAVILDTVTGYLKVDYNKIPK